MANLVFAFLFACWAGFFGAVQAGSNEGSEDLGAVRPLADDGLEELCAAGQGACQESIEANSALQTRLSHLSKIAGVYEDEDEEDGWGDGVSLIQLPDDDEAVSVKSSSIIQSVMSTNRKYGKSIVSEDPPEEEEEADRVKTTSAIQNSKRRLVKKVIPTEDEYAMPIKGSRFIQKDIRRVPQKKDESENEVVIGNSVLQTGTSSSHKSALVFEDDLDDGIEYLDGEAMVGNNMLQGDMLSLRKDTALHEGDMLDNTEDEFAEAIMG